MTKGPASYKGRLPLEGLATVWPRTRRRRCPQNATTKRYPTMGLRSGPARRSLFWDLVRYIKRSSTEVLRVQLYGYVFFNAYLRARCCIVVGFVAASDEEQARAAR